MEILSFLFKNDIVIVVLYFAIIAIICFSSVENFHRSLEKNLPEEIIIIIGSMFYLIALLIMIFILCMIGVEIVDILIEIHDYTY